MCGPWQSHQKRPKHYQLTLSLAAPRQWRPVDGPRAGNVLQRLVRSRFTRWFQSTSQLACELQRSPAPARDPAPIRTTKLPVLIRVFGERPHNLGTLPIPRKMPMLASKLGDSVAGLGNNAKPEAITEFSAKAHAPNHRKITRALAFNAEAQRRPWNGDEGAMERASGGRRPRTAATC